MAIIGIDVSKAKLDCLWLRDSVSLKVKSRVFPNIQAGYRALLAWLEKSTGEATGELHCVMEATGIYHEGLAYALHEAVKQDTQRELNRLEKAQVTQASAEVLTSIETVHQQLDTERVRLETLINEHIDQHPGLKQDRALLESIPGVGPVISQHMVALLRSRSFDAASQCAAFLGLVPSTARVR